MWKRIPKFGFIFLILYDLINISIGAPSSSDSTRGNISTIASTTCQCGVFLLGSPPLQFSADATPTLAGNPVSANCSSLPDRARCANDCQQLVRAMSNQVNPLLVQTLVLSATKTLACQKFNASAKVPLPRIHVSSPIGWRQAERNMRTTDPRWLAGFYRWCDSHWIYAGVSAAEPLCCSNGLPVKCQEAATMDEGAPNPNSNRNPRLIIKKRPEDDLSSEETEPENELTVPASSTTTTTTTTTESTTNNSDTSMEKLEPFTTPKPEITESTLNSTILAEAFQFVGALMRSLGMADVVEGIATVLPTSTATELLKRMDVGGWVSKYQTHYLVYGREFNLGYCYVEYGLYNVANEGVGNIMNRVFGTGKTNRRVRRATTSSRINPATSRVTLKRAITRPVTSVTSGQEAQPRTTTTTTTTSPKTYLPKLSNTPVTMVTNKTTGVPRKVGSTTGTRRQSGGNQSQGPNLMNMANMLMQIASGGNDGDKVNTLLHNALPLMSQVATSPMIQGVVSNIVTNFLTPPDNNNRPPPQAPQKTSSGEESNEIEPLPRPSPPPPMMNGRPPPQQQQQDSGLTGMLGQIVQTYLKHYFSNKNSPPPPPPTPIPSSSPPKVTKNPDKNSQGGSGQTGQTQSSALAEEKSDIVETISEVAKPFFISYFGVVPGIPGFGQLNIAERSGRLREDTLTYDPDAGTGITDLIFGTAHLPSTGNSLFDFGNRVVYSFSRANDPTQGMYCMKQYSVNKLWDGFRLGVKTLFK